MGRRKERCFEGIPSSEKPDILKSRASGAGSPDCEPPSSLPRLVFAKCRLADPGERPGGGRLCRVHRGFACGGRRRPVRTEAERSRPQAGGPATASVISLYVPFGKAPPHPRAERPMPNPLVPLFLPLRIRRAPLWRRGAGIALYLLCGRRKKRTSLRFTNKKKCSIIVRQGSGPDGWLFCFPKGCGRLIAAPTIVHWGSMCEFDGQIFIKGAL